jgi:glycosyltransferase involved in cell wall biosynthesis
MKSLEAPRFTITVPVYNGEKFIAATLDSLLAQTYPHFEIMVLENGSTDKTVHIVRQYSDPRIKLLQSGTLLPIEQNWARILTAPIETEFIVLMCADDILYPQFLEKIVALIAAEPNATLYHSRAIFINEEGRFKGNSNVAAYKESADEFLDAVHDFREAVFGSGYVMRFEDFKQVGGYPKYIKLLFSDIYCYFALTRKGYKVCIPERLVGFRRQEASVGLNAQSGEFTLAAAAYRLDLTVAGYLGRSGNIKLENFIEAYEFMSYRVYVHRFTKIRSNRDVSEFQHLCAGLSPEIKKRPILPYDVPLNWWIQVAQIPNYFVRIVLYCILLVFIRIKYMVYLQSKKATT